MLPLRVLKYGLFKALLCWKFKSSFETDDVWTTRRSHAEIQPSRWLPRLQYVLKIAKCCMVHVLRITMWHCEICRKSLKNSVKQYEIERIVSRNVMDSRENFITRINLTFESWRTISQRSLNFQNSVPVISLFTLLLSGRHHPMLPTLGRAAATSEREKALCTETQLVTHY